MITKTTFIYAEHETLRRPRLLLADLFRPNLPGPFPLLVWMHSGGFRTGSREHPSHSRIADLFAQHGYATAFIDYRLARPPAKLKWRVEAAVEPLQLEAVAMGDGMHITFTGSRALAVVEDSCAFLNYAQTKEKELRLSGRFLLGGSSAGAISALNTLYLPSRLGLHRPGISTVLAMSGGFAYLTPKATGARVLALHNPSDERVPIASIRRLHQGAPDYVCLLESKRQVHGALTLTPRESLSSAVARCVAFDRKVEHLP